MTESLQLIDRTRVRYRGRTLAFFSGCDYFRLSTHPAVRRGFQAGLKRFGLTVAASRATTGEHPLYRRLEQKLARFFDTEDALLLPAGYLAASAAAQALAGNVSHALLDQRAHPALQDAALMLDCPVMTFRHRDPADLARIVARCGQSARLVALTDGMFPYDGAIAPLKAYVKCLP